MWTKLTVYRVWYDSTFKDFRTISKVRRFCSGLDVSFSCKRYMQTKSDFCNGCRYRTIKDIHINKIRKRYTA